MNLLCHRCGATLGASEHILLQLRFPAAQVCPAGRRRERTYAGGRSARRAVARAHGISWKDAILAALFVAVPAGLSQRRFRIVLGMLPVGSRRSGAGHRPSITAALPHYCWKRRAGVRIGAVAGLIAAYSYCHRHRHLAGSSPVTFCTRVMPSISFMILLSSNPQRFVKANPDAEAQWHAYVHFLLSPDGQGRLYTLMNAATTSVGIILFSAIGGALGVRLLAPAQNLISSNG